MLISGGGTNLQALIDAWRAGGIPRGEIALVISDRPGAPGLGRAREASIPAYVIDAKAMGRAAAERLILDLLRREAIDLVVLAGFLMILSPPFISAFPDRIINVHPSLLPAFGGKGFYGLRVHEAALARGVKVTGATVHLVNEVPDGGEILLQRAVRVREGDTPEALQRRVMEQAEWKLLPRAVSQICRRIVKERVS